MSLIRSEYVTSVMAFCDSGHVYHVVPACRTYLSNISMYNYVVLVELPGFSRDSCSIIIHLLVAVFPQFNV